MNEIFFMRQQVRQVSVAIPMAGNIFNVHLFQVRQEGLYKLFCMILWQHQQEVKIYFGNRNYYLLM